MVDFKHLIFGNIDSADYGVYISGDGAFNAPERAVDIVSVPGRNGAIAIDQGRWGNVTVEYPAGIFGADPSEFATKLSAFRNALKAQIGYQRLEDTYHPGEFRSAMFIDAFDVAPVRMTTAGEFVLKFDCKPQRWLTSGETQISVSDGDTVTNPTQYDASPMLEVEGYGDIDINGHVITVENAILGNVDIRSADVVAAPYSVNVDSPLLNAGDTINVGGDRVVIEMVYNVAHSTYILLPPDNMSGGGANVSNNQVNNRWEIVTEVNTSNMTITKGTNSSKTDTLTFRARYAPRSNQDNISTTNVTVSVTRSYNATNNTLTWSYSVTDSGSKVTSSWVRVVLCGDIIGVSTISTLGHPTYIDCDLGEAYKIDGGEIVDLNRYIDLGSNLPVLKAGANPIAHDNTITSIEMTPRWWQL